MRSERPGASSVWPRLMPPVAIATPKASVNASLGGVGEADVQGLDHRLGEARGEPVEQAGANPEHCCAQRLRGPRAQPHQQRHDDRADDQRRDDEAGRLRLIDPGVGIADQDEQGQPDHDDTRAQHLAPDDLLVREPMPERQRPHDRRHHERLDDHELAAIQRSSLRHVSKQQEDQRSQQPDGHRQQPEQAAHALDGGRCCNAAASANHTAERTARTAAMRC
jgi:hypothetical protein